jgi:peptide/nickel transport system permease protein
VRWTLALPGDGRRAAPDRTLLATGAVLAALVTLAIAAPVLAPHGAGAIDLAARRAAPSLAHWFGTDEIGRDVMARVLHGGRVSLAVGIASAFVAIALGVAIGATAAWRGGFTDALLMRATDAMLAIPRLPLLMIAGAILEPTVPTLVLLVGAAGWMETARVVRAEVLSLRARAFVEAAWAGGASGWRIAVRHLLPNAAPAVVVSATLAVGRGILLESALSFFGVGVQPPTASWGNMLYQAQTTMVSEPWLAIFPGLFIFATVVCINALGDRLAAA